MAFKRNNKGLKNIVLIAAFILIAAAYLFVDSLPESVYIEKVKKGYELNAKF